MFIFYLACLLFLYFASIYEIAYSDLSFNLAHTGCGRAKGDMGWGARTLGEKHPPSPHVILQIYALLFLLTDLVSLGSMPFQKGVRSSQEGKKEV